MADGQSGSLPATLPSAVSRTGIAMNISEPFIRRPVGTSLLALGLFLCGVCVAFQFMPVAPVPRVDFPMISVSASLPGADPATVASSLATPLERRLGQIAGRHGNDLRSARSADAAMTIQFDLNRKIDGACARRAGRHQRLLRQADLPINLPSSPTYRQNQPGRRARS